MQRFPAPLLASAASLLIAGCASMEPPEAETAVEVRALVPAELGGLSTVSVCGEIWLSERPTIPDLDLARRRGVRTVIDLRLASERALDADSLAVASVDLGLDYAAYPIDLERTDDAMVDTVLAELALDGRGETLVFCQNGTVAATLFAIYRVVFERVDPDEALDQARAAGMKPGDQEEFFWAQVERLRS